jgi:hypothetical protein
VVVRSACVLIWNIGCENEWAGNTEACRCAWVRGLRAGVRAWVACVRACTVGVDACG